MPLDLSSMPNYKMRLEQIPKAVKLLSAPDGNLYQARCLVDFTVPNPIWMMRTDILETANLELPSPPYDMDAFYNFLKSLKAAFPEMYPLSSAFGGGDIYRNFAVYFHTRNEIYYDFAQQKVLDGRTTRAYRDMLELLKQMNADGILNPEHLTVDKETTQSDLANGKLIGYFAYPSHSGANTALGVQAGNPDFLFQAVEPPYYKGKKPQLNGANPFWGSALAIASMSKEKAAAVKYVDWLYSDEGAEFSNWGEEGVTYDIVNGEKILQPDMWTRESGIPFTVHTEGVRNYWQDLSLRRHGWYVVRMGDAETAYNVDALQAAAWSLNEKYLGPSMPEFVLNQTESDRVAIIGNNVDTILDEAQAKVTMSNLTLADWDAAVARAREVGLDEIEEIHQVAYDRLYKN